MAWSMMSSRAFEVKKDEDVNFPRVSGEEETGTVWKTRKALFGERRRHVPELLTGEGGEAGDGTLGVSVVF